MQCHPLLYYVMYLEHFYLQCSSMVCYGFYLLFTIFFSHAACNEYSQLVEIVVERSIFECNIQKRVPRSFQLKKYVIFKNRNMQLRFEIAMADIGDQLMTNGKLPRLSYRYSQDSHLSWFLELVEEVCHEINLQLPNVQVCTIYM